jgi:gliding motility-associated-like protein
MLNLTYMKSVKYFCINPVLDLLVPWTIKLILSMLLLSLCATGHSSSDEVITIPVLPPVAICKNISVQLGPGGSVTITPSDVDAGSYDPDGTITSMIVSPSSFNCSQKGTNSVTLTVTDDEGKSAACTAIVTVEDRIAPSVICKDYTLYLDATGKGTLAPGDINNGSSDNCSAGLFLYVSRTDFSCSDIGSPVNVTLTGTDGSGNLASCTSRITVLDTISPVVNYKPFTLVLGASGSATLSASDIDNGSFDNCSSVVLSVSPSAFTCSDLGQKIVTLTATDSYGNSSKRSVPISVISTLKITGMSLSSCEMAPTLALFESDKEGGDGTYSHFWKGLDISSKPFMVIIPFPPSLQFSNTSILQEPFFNNTMPDGFYDIRLVVTDGKGCKDSSDIRINKTGAIFNNQTLVTSEACEGEVKTYSVLYKPDATYNWSVTNGTILTGDPDTSRIEVLWDLGVTGGVVSATITEPNILFTGGQCESTVTGTVTINPLPTPAFDNPVLNACHDFPTTYTLTGSYAFHIWTVVGGVIVSGGTLSDNYVTVRWLNTPSGIVAVSAGNNIMCMGSAALTVNIFDLTGSVTAISDITCNGGSDGSVTVQAGPGSGMAPYSFSLDGGAYQAGGTFTGLSLGNHFVRIRDALLCTFDVPFVIDQPFPVTGSVSSLKDVSCFGGSDGSVTITSSGGTPPHQYRLNGGPLQVSNIFSGLIAGSYTVTVVDANGCTGTVIFSIVQPVLPLNGSSSVTNVLCFGESTGRIDLSVSGGTSPYSYLWSNGGTQEDLVNIPAGNYSVVITDANGCTATVNATILQPSAALSGSTSVTNILCFGGSTGSVNLTVSGGTPPYSYLWNNGATTEVLLNIPAGNYSVVITDGNGCIINRNATVTQPASALGGTIATLTNVACFGGTNGSVTVAGTGGTAPYEYRSGSGPYQPSGTFGSLGAGVYNITVRDANLCTFIIPVTISQPSSALNGNIVTQTNVDCFGNSTGSVTVGGSGGTPPYQYSLDSGVFQVSGIFTGLSEGVHNVVVRDGNMCIFNVPVTITQPSLPLGVSITSADVICKGEPTGTATANVSGGTSPYTYSWNTVPSQTNQTASGLPAGSYTVTVTDNNNCISTASIDIDEPLLAISASLSISDASCNGGSDGEIDLTVSNGTGPYGYLWSNGSVTEDITGVAAGSYSVTVTDSNGCVANSSGSIGQPAAISGTFAVTDAGCFGESTGSVDLSVSGGTPPYAFLWDGGAVSEDLTSMPAGNYSVTITDSHGCTALLNTVVGQPSLPLSGTITNVSDVTVYGGNDGSITLAGSGGTSPYQYSLNSGPFQSSPTFGSLTAGIYQVQVKDANGCTFDLMATVGEPWIPLSANILSQSDVKCTGGSDGSVTVAGWGGTAPYMYSLNGGAFQASGTFSSISAGSYTIIVRDGVADTYNQPFTISEPEQLTVSVTGTDAQCLGSNSGTATAIPEGGTGPYTYLWNVSPQQTAQTISDLAAGTYTVTVTDANGCISSGNVDISQAATEMTIVITKTDVLCGNGATGNATASVSGGLAPYYYSWDTTPVLTTETVSGLAAGTYAVTVTDSYGCVKTESVTIAELPVLSLSAESGEASCPDSNDGSITLSVSGGTAPYTVFWSDGAMVMNRTTLYPGLYGVVVTDHNGCAESLSVEVGFTFSYNCLVIPQVLTPNGDGFNDEWIIRNIDLYPDAEVHIFNRWGQEVFTTKNLADNPWDGRYKGKLVPTDSYHYILYLNDGSAPRTGVISVIR